MTTRLAIALAVLFLGCGGIAPFKAPADAGPVDASNTDAGARADAGPVDSGPQSDAGADSGSPEADGGPADGGDGTWHNVTPTTGPSPRYGMGMAFDTVRKVTLLFGGCCGVHGTPLGDMWSYDGTTWTELTPARLPTAGFGAMAYDSEHQLATFVHAGQNMEAWSWNGITWSLKSAGAVPDRDGFSLAFARDHSVLFGGYGCFTSGCADSAYLDDNWYWSGSWGQSSATTPPARSWHAMAGANPDHLSVLFGGYNASGWLTDSWGWDSGQTWFSLDTHGTSPGPHADHAMAFDSARTRTVLFGGRNQTSDLADTWEWDESTWQERHPVASPSARRSHAMVYDSRRGVTVLFGGQDSNGSLGDTWEWNGR